MLLKNFEEDIKQISLGGTKHNILFFLGGGGRGLGKRIFAGMVFGNSMISSDIWHKYHE